MTVFLGNGDGTFGTGVNYVSGANAATSVAVGDLNGDGNLDMAVTSNPSGNVDHKNGNGAPGILLGKGDGTFQPVVFTSGAGKGNSIVMADFDGNLDLAVGGLKAQICLGKGDGTFQPPFN